MAIAKGRVSSLDSYYENLHKEGSSPSQSFEEPSSLGLFGLMDQKNPKGETHGGNQAESNTNYSSSSGSGFRFGTLNSPFVESHNSIFNFKSTINSSGGCNYTSTSLSSSMLSFEQAHQLEDYSAFADAFNDPNSLIGMGNGQTEDEYWACSEKAAGSELLEGTLRKRPHMGGDLQPSKKLSTGSSQKKISNVKVVPKDPQSIAAKNRRERISERLKILQDLVPNGTKVDMVTMLEKAINYVKFLQLQVKVLATDEFWPTQGGKAPEPSQVKEAIDAILSSQKSPTLK